MRWAAACGSACASCSDAGKGRQNRSGTANDADPSEGPAIRLFQLILAGAQWPDRLIACLGAAIGIALTMVVCAGLPLPIGDMPFIVAPLGASAVLVFAVPASPLAQPWPVVGGNIVSTLVGVAIFHLVPQPFVAAGVAVGAAILVMSLLRCLHPPGGAAALTAVIGSQAVHDAGYGFAFAPVGINSIALVTLAVVFHRWTARAYPHQPAAGPETIRAARAAAGFTAADIDAALAEMHDSFDIDRADLDLLLAKARLHAIARRR
jgi:CBS domain-containing membrane protein